MKQLFQFLAGFLLLFSSQAQTVDSAFWTRSNSYTRMTGIKGDSVMAPPSIKANKGKYPGSFMYNPYIKGFEVYDSITKRWYPILSILQDGLISGGNVSWTGTGLSFYVSEAVYVVEGVLRFSNDTTVTLATADPTNPRQDVIALNNIGVYVLTGTPAADPAKPQVTPGSELELTSILVNAGATTPTGVTQEVIYDENTEWTVGSSELTINADNTTSPYRGSKSIDLSSYAGGADQMITFTRGSILDMTQYSLLTLYVKLKADYPNNATINVQFQRVSGFFILSNSSIVTISNSNYNYVRTNDGVYQTIQIPLSDFTFSSWFYPPSEMNKLVLTFNNAAAGMYIDYVNLQGGINLPSNGVTSYNGRGGNVVPLKADYAQWFLDSTYRRADSVFGTKNGVEYFQHIDSVGAGSSYTFTNGVKESGGTVTAGGDYEADSISYVSNSNKTFRIQSRANSSSQLRTDWYQDRFRISGKAFNGNVNSFGQIEASAGYAFLYGQSAAGDYGVIQADANLGRVTAFDGTVGRQVRVSPTGIDFTDENSASSTNRFEADSSIHYKRLTYAANYRSLFTPFTLVDKGYVDSLAGTISGSTSLNNAGTGYDIAVEGTSYVKRIAAGTNITLDSTTTDSTIIINASGGGSADSTYQTIEIGTAPTTVGVVVNETFSGGSIPSGWSKGSGLTTDYTGGKLTVTGAASLGAPNPDQNTTPYGSGMQYDTERFPYEKWRIEMDVVPTTKSADAYLGFAEASNGGFTYSQHRAVMWDVSNAYSSGKSFVGLAANYTTKDSTQTADWSVNDSLTLYAEKNGWSMTTGFINKTTGKVYVNRYSINNNGQGGRLNFIFLNGTYVVTRATVKINAVKNEVLFLGHSMASGSGASIEQLRYANLVMRNAQNRFNVVGLPSVRAEMVYKNGVASNVLTRLTPTHVVIDLGHNDMFEPNSEFTPAQAKLYVDSVAQLAVAAGATVSILAQPPLQTNDDILNDSLIALSAREGYTFIPVKQVLANGAVGYDRYRYDGVHYNDSGYYKVAEIITAKVGNVLLTKESADTNFVVKAHNIPYAKTATVVNLLGEQPDGSVVRVPNFFSPTNRIENKFSLESSIAQKNSKVHVDHPLISDSALFIHTTSGLRIGFNGGNLTSAGTTGSNMVFTNAGVGGIGYPQVFPTQSGLRQVIFQPLTLKQNGGVTLSGNDLFVASMGNAVGNISGSRIVSFSGWVGNVGTLSGSDNYFMTYESGKNITTGTNNFHAVTRNPAGTSFANSLTGTTVLGDFQTSIVNIANQEVWLSSGNSSLDQVFRFGGGGGADNNYFYVSPTWSGSNRNGSNWYFRSSAGRGTGGGGRFIFQTYNTAASGTTLQTSLNTELSIDRDSIQIDALAKFNSQIQVKVTTGISAASDYTVLSTDYYFELPDLAGQANRTVTLPTNTGTGRTLIIKNKDSDGTNSWSFSVAVKDNADGDVTALTDDKVYHLVWNGTNWIITMVY